MDSTFGIAGPSSSIPSMVKVLSNQKVVKMILNKTDAKKENNDEMGETFGDLKKKRQSSDVLLSIEEKRLNGMKLLADTYPQRKESDTENLDEDFASQPVSVLEHFFKIGIILSRSTRAVVRTKGVGGLKNRRLYGVIPKGLLLIPGSQYFLPLISSLMPWRLTQQSFYELTRVIINNINQKRAEEYYREVCLPVVVSSYLRASSSAFAGRTRIPQKELRSNPMMQYICTAVCRCPGVFWGDGVVEMLSDAVKRENEASISASSGILVIPNSLASVKRGKAKKKVPPFIYYTLRDLAHWPNALIKCIILPLIEDRISKPECAPYHIPLNLVHLVCSFVLGEKVSIPVHYATGAIIVILEHKRFAPSAFVCLQWLLSKSYSLAQNVVDGVARWICINGKTRTGHLHKEAGSLVFLNFVLAYTQHYAAGASSDVQVQLLELLNILEKALSKTNRISLVKECIRQLLRPTSTVRASNVSSLDDTII